MTERYNVKLLYLCTATVFVILTVLNLIFSVIEETRTADHDLRLKVAYLEAKVCDLEVKIGLLKANSDQMVHHPKLSIDGTSNIQSSPQKLVGPPPPPPPMPPPIQFNTQLVINKSTINTREHHTAGKSSTSPYDSVLKEIAGLRRSPRLQQFKCKRLI
jgi:hypothetical protein